MCYFRATIASPMMYRTIPQMVRRNVTNKLVNMLVNYYTANSLENNPYVVVPLDFASFVCDACVNSEGGEQAAVVPSMTPIPRGNCRNKCVLTAPGKSSEHAGPFAGKPEKKRIAWR